MSNEIIVDRGGPGVTITLNRPDHGNAMSDAMAAELTGLLNEEFDTAAYVVLRAAGDDFCVGRATMGVRAAGPEEALQRRRNSEVVFDCYAAFRRSPIPIIGVVQGRAIGFGCALAGLCDITIASETARFQISEMAHNILPTMVLSALVDRVPRKALTYLVYSTAEISAMRAMEVGLVSEVVPAGELEATLQALSTALLKAPRPALRGVKEYVRSAYAMDTQGAIDFARNLHATINSSSEMRKKP